MTSKNPKGLSQLDPGSVLKNVHDYEVDSLRIIDGKSEVPADYTKVDLTYNSSGSVTQAVFTKGTSKEITEIETIADVSGSLNNTYFYINSAEDEQAFYVWFNVNSAGTDPNIADKVGIEIPIETNDTAAVIAAAISIYLGNQRNFDTTRSGNVVRVENVKLGATTNALDVDTAFNITTLQAGASSTIKTITIPYTNDVKYTFNTVEKKFEVSAPIDVEVTNFADVDFATETTLASLDGKDFATETTLASLEGKDFATETTLASVDTNVSNIDTNITNIDTNVGNIDTSITNIDTSTTSIDTKLPASLGRKISDESLSATLSINEDVNLTKIDRAATNVTYTGKTYDLDAADVDEVWQIKREASSGDLTTIEYVSDGEFNQKWSDRNTLFGPVPFSNDSSVQFDGLSYIDFGTPNQLEFDKDDAFSIVGWFKTNESTNQTIVAYQDNLIGSDGWTIRMHSSGAIELRLLAGATNRIFITSTTVGLNDLTWHSFCVTYDGSEDASGINLYIDGAVDTFTTNANNLTNNIVYAGEVVIGARSNVINDPFDGNIDEIAVFNVELSSVTALAITATVLDLNEVTEASSLQWWARNGDGDIYPIILDQSQVENNIDGLMVNMSTDDIVGDAP